MDTPEYKLTSQFRDQMNPTTQPHQTYTDIQEDIHICGLCKQSFTDIHLFLQHKSDCNIILTTTSNNLADSQVNYVISDQTLFRISGLSFDSASLPIFIQSDDSTDKLNHVLQTQLIHSTDQSSTKKDNIQIDEEDVASLLVNQLSKEVLNSAPIDIGSKAADAQNIEGFSHVIPIDNKDSSAQQRTEVIIDYTQDYIELNPGKGKVACSVCSFVPHYPRDLIRHMRRHTGERPYECNVCNRRFTRHDKLQTHKRIHTGDKPYQCQLCSYATTDSGPLRKHLRTHTDERPHKCQMCPYRARDSSQLTVHLRTHTGDCPFMCQVERCGRAFKTSTDLKRHNNVHTKNNALLANKQTTKEIESQEQSKTLSTQEPGTQAMEFPCVFVSCDYMGTSLRDLRSHSKLHLGTSDSSYNNGNDANRNLKTNTKTFSCDICNSNYRYKSNLQSHLKKHQLVSNSGIMRPICTKSYQCHMCNAAFVRADSLRSHVRQHKQNDRLQIEFEGFVNKEIESIAVTSDGSAHALDITNGHTGTFDLLVTATAEGSNCLTERSPGPPS